LLEYLGSTERVTFAYAVATVFRLGNSLLMRFLIESFGIAPLWSTRDAL